MAFIILWFVAVIAVVVAGSSLILKARWLGRAWRHRCVSAVIFFAVSVVLVFANFALTRHDKHFDFTREQHFTPDRDAIDIVSALEDPVLVTFFYRDDDKSGQRTRRTLELMARRNSLFAVRFVDPDKDPAAARRNQVAFHNVTLIESQKRRLLVNGTDEAAIARGVRRAVMESTPVICFLQDHGEYRIDNEEFHTHLEGLGGHADHDHGHVVGVIETTQHGVGRFRRALEGLGYAVRAAALARSGAIDPDCDVVVGAGPQVSYQAVEFNALSNFLAAGKSALLLFDINYESNEATDAFLAQHDVTLLEGVVSDPRLHYAGDPSTVAITGYAPHALTKRLSLSFFPGVRPVAISAKSDDSRATPLFESSTESTLEHHANDSAGHHGHHHGAQTYTLGVAVEPSGADLETSPYRLLIVGDSDFASNSFFPYMSNQRLAINMVRWLLREEMSSPVSVETQAEPMVRLTNTQQRELFVWGVIAPAVVVLAIYLIVAVRRR